MNRWKKLLAMLLCIVMVLSLIPSGTVFAEEFVENTEIAAEETVENEDEAAENSIDDADAPAAEEIIDAEENTDADTDAAEQETEDASETEDTPASEEASEADAEEPAEETPAPEDAAEAEAEEASEETEEVQVDPPVYQAYNGRTVLAFTSDIHNTSNNTAANRLKTWLGKMADIYGGVDYMSFCGDMGGAQANESQFWEYTQSVMDVVENDWDITGTYTTGNHEFYNGKFSSTSNSVKAKYKLEEVGLVANDFILYCLGTDNWNNNSDNYPTEQINKLSDYLNSIGNEKPIIILTHFPLHRFSSRSSQNADKVIDVLNAAVASGKKIVLLWGHNHTMSDTYYDEIYLPGSEIEYNSSGAKKVFNFYYGAAGCMSDSEYGSGSAFVKGKGLVITIDSQKKLSFAYYDANGNNVTEGGTYTEEDPVYATGITITEKPVTLEQGRSKTLSVTYSPAETNVKGVAWSSNDTAVATVDANGKVRGVAPGTAVITAAYQGNTSVTDTCTVTVTERTSTENYYVIKSGSYVLSTEKSSDAYDPYGSSGSGGWGGWGGYGGSSSYKGLVAVADSSAAGTDETTRWILEETDGGYYIRNLDGLYLNATYTSSGSSSYSSSVNAELKLDDTEDVWVLDSGIDLDSWEIDGSYLKSTNASSGQSSDKYLAEETGTNGTHLFTIRSKDNADLTTIELAGDPVPVTGVTVTPTEGTVMARKTIQLTAVVQPENATNKKVNWSSSNTSVATVDSNGKVRGVSEGTATITATTADGGKTASAVITVTPNDSPAEPGYVIVIDGYALSINRSSNTAQGGNSSYTYTGLAGVPFTSADEADDEARWIFEETTGGYFIKSLDGRYLNGTYTSGSNSGKGDLKLDDTQDIWVLDSGYSLDTGSVDGSYLKSSNASGTASSDKYLGYEEGSANLFTVRSKDNADTVTIEEAGDPVAVTGVSVTPETATVEAGKTVQLTAVVTPSDATNKNVTWSSSNTAVATVSTSGKVRGVAEGTATITVTTADGGKQASATITVIPGTAPSEPSYVITIGSYAMSTEPSDDELTNSGSGSQRYTYTGLAGVTYRAGDDADDSIRWIFEETSGGYYIKSLDGRYLNATYESNSSGGYTGELKLDETKDVWVFTSGGSLESGVVDGSKLKTTNASAGQSSDKCLAEETGSSNTHFFTIRSESNADEVTVTEVEDTTPTVIAVTGVTLTPASAEIEKDTQIQLTAAVIPGNATNQAVSFTSSDPAVASVDANGKVTGLKAGTATITVTTADGGKTASSVITVVLPPMDQYSIAISADRETAAPGETVDFTVTLGPVDHLATMQLTLSIPEGLEYISGSAAVAENLQTALGFDTLDWTESMLMLNGYGTRDYANESETVLLTFQCKVKDGVSGEQTVTLADGFEIYDEAFTDYSGQYTITPAVILAHVHSYTGPVWSWSEDHSSASAVFTCEECGDVVTLEAEVTSLLEHATCEADGSALYTASVLFEGKTYTDEISEVLPKLGHAYVFSGFEWTESEDFGWDAVAVFHCENGNHDDTVIPALEIRESPVSCTEDGKIIYTASVTAEKSLDGKAHSEEKVVVTQEALGHDYQFVDFTWTGNDADGYTGASANFQCKRASAHKLSVEATRIVKRETASTCAEAGKVTYTALLTAGQSPDGEAHSDQKEVLLPKAAHTLVKTEAVEASCETAGNTAYFTCEVCGKFFLDEAGTEEIEEGSWIIPARGHEWGDWTVVKEPTCTEEGEETRTCAVCGEQETRAVEARGHRLEKVEATAPDGTHDGYAEYYVCKECGLMFADEEGKNEITEVPVGEESLHKQFVRMMYYNVLGRELDFDDPENGAADKEGFDSFTAALDAGMTGAEVAAKFIFSNENKAKNLCNNCYITLLYRTILGREPEPASDTFEGALSYWNNVLTLTDTSRFDAFIMFVYPDSETQEFKEICEKYEVRVATSAADIDVAHLDTTDLRPVAACSVCGYSSRSQIEAFVKRLYVTCLGRDADEEGLKSWADGLMAGGTVTGYYAAYRFVFGDQEGEGQNHELTDQNLCNEHFVKRMYKALLDRELTDSEADQQALASYVAALDAGMTREEVFDKFVAGTNDFATLCRRAGIIPGTGEGERYPIPKNPADGTHWDPTKPCAECGG